MFDFALTITEGLMHLSIVIMVGLYFIFSNTIMTVLAGNSSGASIMIEINRQILNPIFLALFVLSGISGLYFFFVYSGFQALGGLLFFAGTTLVTMLFNVPLNNGLRDSPKANFQSVWQVYLNRWVLWNHVRTISAVLSGFMLSV